MEVNKAFPKAFAIWFKDLYRWDAASFHDIEWHWSKEIMAPIGSVIRIRKEKVDRSKYAFCDLQPITIHFDGSVDLRNVDGREYTMDMFFAYPTDIIVAKIDLKNGAVGIVPKHWKNVAVTNHFAVYEANLFLIVPEYLHLIIQTSFFKAHLSRNKVGAEGRKEVKIDFFESLKIPIPPLKVQQAIVEKWQKAQEEISAASGRVEYLKAEIDSQLFKDLGMKPPTQAIRPKAFAVEWKDFLRWSVSYNQITSSNVDISQGKYPTVELGSILEMLQYGTSEKANSNGEGTPVIRMNNIVEGLLDLQKLKHIKLSKTEIEKLLLQDGDILFNRTNSKELVGKCAVFHLEEKCVFASYLIRVRINPLKANADFVAHVINSAIGRQQIDALSRQIIGQANINSEELRSLQIPLPPLNVQQAIVEQVQEGRKAKANEREAAKLKTHEIKAEIEAIIQGIKQLEAM